MKKLVILLLSAVLCITLFAGCAGKGDKLENVDGEVVFSSSFATVKGDYMYFVNGKESVTASNKFGKVQKGALLRVKTSELASLKEANVETVIPKLVLTGNYKQAFYMFGDYVYFGTPCDDKDKTGAVMTSKTEFLKYNLKTAKYESKAIAVMDNNANDFRFVENGGKVYLVFTVSETVDSAEKKYIKVYNCDSGDNVYTSKAYSELSMSDDGAYIYFTVVGKNALDQDDNFNDIYRYVVGQADGELVLSGASASRANELNLVAGKRYGNYLQGTNFTLVKNQNGYLFVKATSADTSNGGSSYFLVNLNENASDFSTRITIGSANAILDKIITSSMYVKNANEVYFTNSDQGLVKFNYEKLNNDNFLLYGMEMLSVDAKGYALQFISGNYAYLSNTAEGIYYRYDLVNGGELEKLNVYSYETGTSWYAPIVYDKYIIGALSNELFANYLYVTDMSALNLVEDDDATQESITSIYNGRLGLVTDSDKESMQTAFDSKFNKN